MNKQEAINELKKYKVGFGEAAAVRFDRIVSVINQIHEPQKVVVSQVAVEYYNTFKDYGYSLVELLGDFCYQSTREKFPRLNELETWLYGNDEATNRQRELALATLILNGPDAVEIEQEKLYTVEVPDPNSRYTYRFLSKNDRGVFIDGSCDDCWKDYNRNHLTEAEIKEDFEWAWQWAKEVE
ncbi:DUF1642 domain-containing protein [Streptococcus suis]|uniref:DUF1642 domain-containing protein n=1 Tax=Streptococcus suis TaxID=1307 RepID=UPI000CF72020|nr:DUF1642 domain-containing protein [Streptococcus suis]